ncbi:MAG: cbb3-type cytochrome c oxidase subunit 3 [Rhodobacteraceae bacterium]|nr:cbb3-type cytochrome c oxidase subunit 3 [Paracoccaceae bacterium]MCY4196810.1 cbb3-type cytochrome c oxidase subunit 3 [Paracoccaceae bacterium]
MEVYTFLREFADSWALLALMATFIFVVVYTCRRSSRKMHDDCADIPFRYEDSPASGNRHSRSG